MPIIKIQPERQPPYCIGDSVQLNTVRADNHQLLWSTGENTNSITIKSGGIYSVWAIAGSGCKNEDSLQIIFHPVSNIDLGPDTVFCEGDLIPITLNAGQGFTKYQWNNHETSDSIFYAYKSGIYFVKVFNVYGCSSEDSITILNSCASLFIPNLITPNNDGKNDFLQ